MTIKPVTLLPQFWLNNTLPPSTWNWVSLAFVFLRAVYDTAVVKIIYQKIGFALKTDAATQQSKDGVCRLLHELYNSDSDSYRLFMRLTDVHLFTMLKGCPTPDDPSHCNKSTSRSQSDREHFLQ